MKYLYNENELNELNKLEKRNIFFAVLFLALFAISLIIFLLVSSYQTRVLFSIISSVIGVGLIFFAIYFFYRFLYIKRIKNEYDTLFNSEDHFVMCEILECSSFLTTLPDKTRCYEVLVRTKEKETIYYLSEIFNRESFKPGKCKILVSYDYIKGYQYEN